jgi:hypothetical protein
VFHCRNYRGSNGRTACFKYFSYFIFSTGKQIDLDFLFSSIEIFELKEDFDRNYILIVRYLKKNLIEKAI